MIPWAARHKHQSESSTYAFKIIFGVDAGIILIKEYGPYGPQGPWAHKTKMFLLSSYYVVIIILIMMIQGQGQGPGAKARTQKRRW